MPELGFAGEQKIILETASEIAGEEVFVIVKKAILAIDVEELDETDDRKTYGYKFLSKLILQWNLTLNGSPAPITAENVAKLPVDDLQQIEKETNFDKQLSRLKKNSSFSSSPVEEKTEQVTPQSNISS